jgi:bacterial/archaeal transporter family-2 protein
VTVQNPTKSPQRVIPLPKSMLVLAFIFILIGGALRSVEAGCQNMLKQSLHNVWVSAVVSYGVALTGVSIILVVTLVIRGRRPWPTRSDIKAMPKWAPFGGLTGGSAIFAMIAVANSVGVSTFNALIIGGQMFAAAAIDHFGVMGFPRRRITPTRIAACVMLIVGNYLMARY